MPFSTCIGPTGVDALLVTVGRAQGPAAVLPVPVTEAVLASLALYALQKLPRELMDLPANGVVFRVL